MPAEKLAQKVNYGILSLKIDDFEQILETHNLERDEMQAMSLNLAKKVQ